MDAIGIDFTALLPAFMRAQEDDAAMAAALSPILRARALQLASLGIADFLCDAASPLTDAQASTLLDSLAAYLGLEWWRADWDTPTKRSMVAQAEKLRQLSESKWALETILRAYFGDPALTVEEWWDYGGAPYCFRVLTSNADAQAALRYKNVVELIKRQSQQWEGLWAGFSCRGVIYRGALGTDDTRLTCGTVAYRYLPTGTTVDGADGLVALSALLTEANPGQAVGDVFDDCIDYGLYKVIADLPLTFREYGLPDWEAISSTGEAGARLDAAMAAHWADVGASIDLPAMAPSWPPGGGTSADLLTGLAYHYGFGAVGAASWTSDGGVGGTMEVNTRTSATGGASGKIDGGVAFSAGDGKAYRNAAAETVDGQLLIFGRKNADWSAAVWLKGSDSADTNDGRRSALAFNTNSGGGYVVTLGTSDGGLPALIYGTPPTAPLVEGTADILDGGWHLLVATHDTEAEEVALYLDGTLVGTSGDSALFSGTGNVTAPFFIGRSNWSAAALCLVGSVDEVALWHGRAIGLAEVQALWNGGAGLPFADWT